MTDVKIEAVAWAVVSPGGLIRCTYNEPPDELRILSAESSGDTIEPRYPESTITALQERIAELTNANLRMLGERDRARIAEAEVAKLRALIDGAATGEVVEVGDDESGQPRVLIHSTRDELRKGAALAFRKVCIVPIGKALAGEP